MKTSKDPLEGPFGAICKFFGAALFGCFVSVVFLYIMVMAASEGFWSPPWIHLLWLVPVAWGVLGIFRFNEMLDAGRGVLEGLCGLH